MEKLCGTCTKASELSKEERIELAMSRQPNVVYTCPTCKEEHSFQVREVKKPVQSETQVEKIEEKPKKAKKKKENEQEQLSLF